MPVRYDLAVNGSAPHVVIIGGGFGGLYAAKRLAGKPVRITLIDRRNHHLFQPLLYEVATAALSPADIAAPIRTILARYDNVTVLMASAQAVDLQARQVRLADGAVAYDYLIMAPGATHSYFGHDEWARFARGLKTLDDALEIRRRFLLAFEAAEREADPEARRAKLTFVIVGGGPTGVELAGTMAELARRAIPRDFRLINTATARVVLVEASDRVLGTFVPRLSQRARRDLESLGVEVRLNSKVTGVDQHGVTIDGDGARHDDGAEASPTGRRVDAENVIWAAGVQASPLGKSLGVPLDHAGRVIVGPDLSVPGHPEVFVIGDMAAARDARSGELVPGVAPAAMQMGRHAARLIGRETRGRLRPAARPAFRFVDKGMLATIGRAKAVGSIKGVHFAGPIAWLLWALVHILYCISFRNRLLVMIDWAWAYVMFQRGARLITGESQMHLHQPRSEGLDARMPMRG